MERYRYPDKATAAAAPMPALGASADAPSTSPGAPPRARVGPRPPRRVALQAATHLAALGARAPLVRAAQAWALPSTRPCRRSPGRACCVAVGFRRHSGRVLPALGVSAGHRTGSALAMAEESRTVSFRDDAALGTIYDRNGIVLATSVEATTIYANPVEVTDAAAEWRPWPGARGRCGRLPRASVHSLPPPFTSSARPSGRADKVKELKLDGVTIADTRREYPNGSIGGQGSSAYCERRRRGHHRPELQYNDILSGTPGTLHRRKRRAGIPIPGGVKEGDAGRQRPGHHGLPRHQAAGHRGTGAAEGVKDLGDRGGLVHRHGWRHRRVYAACSVPHGEPGRHVLVAGAANR